MESKRSLLREVLLLDMCPALRDNLITLRDILLTVHVTLPNVIVVKIIKLDHIRALRVLILQQIGRVDAIDQVFRRYEKDPELLAKFVSRLPEIQEKMLTHKSSTTFLSECVELYKSLL